MTQPTLEYAPPPPLLRRKVFRRAALGLGIVAIVACSWIVLPRYWHNAQAASRHRQWMRFTRAPTVIAFEPPGKRAHELFQPGSDYIMRPGGVFHNPPEFTEPVLFLHGRRRPDGQRRVVWVSLGYVRNYRMELRLQGDVLIPATLGRPGWRAPGSAGPLLKMATGAPRIYAGQPDPNNESHFTMKYEFDNGATGIIHGWLRDDDTIHFETREDPPAGKESK